MFENTDNFDVGYNYYEDPLDKIFEAFDTLGVKLFILS